MIGSETHANMMRAYDVPEAKIIQVKGGENMQFDGYDRGVSRAAFAQPYEEEEYAVPGHRVSVPELPKTVGALREGDSLIYLITIGGKFRIFLMSTANFTEQLSADSSRTWRWWRRPSPPRSTTSRRA